MSNDHTGPTPGAGDEPDDGAAQVPPTPPYGQTPPPYGQPVPPPYGQTPQPPYGQTPQPPYGQPQGQTPPPYGQPYGQTPPPYGQPYGQPGAPFGQAPQGPGLGVPATGPFSFGEGFTVAWRLFTARVGMWLGIIAILALAGIVASGLGGRYTMSTDISDAGFRATDLLAGAGWSVRALLGSFLTGFVGALGSFLIVQHALRQLSGAPVSFGSFFSIANAQVTLVCATVLGGVSLVADRIPFFGGVISLAVSIFTLFAGALAAEVGAHGISPLTDSAKLVMARPGESFATIGAGILLFIAGAAACCVGLLVTVPMAGMYVAYTFQRLHGRPIV